LIYAQGTSESRGSVFGVLFGSADGFLLGRGRGTNQSLLAKKASPPRKAPYLAPAVLWFIGFFIVMAFAGQAKLSATMKAISFLYVSALPAWFAIALVHNIFVYPGKYEIWSKQWLCERCGHRM
jgi:hypothetical protein